MTGQTGIPPAPPILLGSLNPGDSLRYTSGNIEMHFDVLDTDERGLPVVEVSASEMPDETRGHTLVQRINEQGMRGILLGTIDAASGDMVGEGMIRTDVPYSALALEMIDNSDEPDDNGMFVSAFPSPDTRPLIKRNS